MHFISINTSSTKGSFPVQWAKTGGKLIDLNVRLCHVCDVDQSLGLGFHVFAYMCSFWGTFYFETSIIIQSISSIP